MAEVEESRRIEARDVVPHFPRSLRLDLYPPLHLLWEEGYLSRNTSMPLP
jgi:hypothetical protein